jgi:hypothetical protein
VLLQPGIPADAEPRRVYPVQSRVLRQRHQSVRVLQVRGGALLRGRGCDGRRNVPDVLCGRVVAGGQPDLRGLSGEFEFAVRVRCAHSLHLQRRGDRAGRANLCAMRAGEIQGRSRLCRVHRVFCGAVLNCRGCHECRNMSVMLCRFLVGGGKLYLRGLSFKFQFTSRINSDAVYLQRRVYCPINITF